MLNFRGSKMWAGNVSACYEARVFKNHTKQLHCSFMHPRGVTVLPGWLWKSVERGTMYSPLPSASPCFHNLGRWMLHSEAQRQRPWTLQEAGEASGAREDCVPTCVSNCLGFPLNGTETKRSGTRLLPLSPVLLGWLEPAVWVCLEVSRRGILSYPCFLKEILLTFHHKRDMCRGVFKIPFPGNLHFLLQLVNRTFYHQWILYFIKGFFCIYWDDQLIPPFNLLMW